MAVGEYSFPSMPALTGVRLATTSAGIKKPGRQDLVLIELAEGTRTAGVFTRNAFCAAPVTLCREYLKQSRPRFLVINSGNANACTGERGRRDAIATSSAVARLASVMTEQVLPFSTGVIGEPLPLKKIEGALPSAYEALSDNGWEAAAKAIMTTDTRPKGFTGTVEHEGNTVTVNGIAKGAGMIRPNMGTMLAYIATDADIAQTVLEDLCKEAANRSFNRITIDGDTSTNDACVLMATGTSAAPLIEKPVGELYEKVRALVIEAHEYLAKCIVADGEGATKFVTLEINGGANDDECLQVGYAVAHSPLIKTALFACDPNWGRIVAAVGYAGVSGLDPSKVCIQLNDTVIVENGARAESYTEEQGQAVMDGEEIAIRIHLGRGDARQRLWTTDLSHEYVRINADYRS